MPAAAPTHRSPGSRRRAARTRLDPEARRAQLIETGLEMLRARPPDQVSVDEIARAAGISRGLLFHYFPTKRDFHVAVARAAADELLAVTTPDPSVDELTRLRAGLDGFVGYMERNLTGYLALVRGATGADPQLAQVHESTRLAIVERVLQQLDVSDPPPLLRHAVRGWVAMVEEATVAWLDEGEPARDDLIRLFEEGLVQLVTVAAPAIAADIAGRLPDA